MPRRAEAEGEAAPRHRRARDGRRSGAALKAGDAAANLLLDSASDSDHPHGFTVWLYGAGIRRGVVHGATDELGFHAVEAPHYATDIHATVLDRLGLDGRRLVVPGRKRLDIDRGGVIKEICTWRRSRAEK